LFLHDQHFLGRRRVPDHLPPPATGPIAAVRTIRCTVGSAQEHLNIRAPVKDGGILSLRFDCDRSTVQRRGAFLGQSDGLPMVTSWGVRAQPPTLPSGCEAPAPREPDEPLHTAQT